MEPSNHKYFDHGRTWLKGNMSGGQFTRQNSGARYSTTVVPDPTTTVVRTDSGYNSVVPGGYTCNLTSYGDSALPMFYK
ncbi:hypothetical protein GIB67_000532 [Kingdonia uniflora]|uniref:Uncharacterized protein n=1 Tax=Kingdonia uniflora TaxID=39325 RepID=A0A7J7MIU6_9MAGN|nr:hypothetical protein GIB67_000532 [Kingdonia uniflora]